MCLSLVSILFHGLFGIEDLIKCVFSDFALLFLRSQRHFHQKVFHFYTWPLRTTIISEKYAESLITEHILAQDFGELSEDQRHMPKIFR